MGNENKEHYDNNGIRKGILLSRFVTLIKEWIQNDDNAEKQLSVSLEYKQKFTKFQKYFESEMKVLNDESLSKELNILSTLSGLEAEVKLIKSVETNRLYEYNQNGGWILLLCKTGYIVY